jgi:hypothetical protein
VKSEENQKDEDVEKKRGSIPKDCGICVMTSSALGDVVMGKILAANLLLERLAICIREAYDAIHGLCKDNRC